MHPSQLPLAAGFAALACAFPGHATQVSDTPDTPDTTQARRQLSTLERRAGWFELDAWRAVSVDAFPARGWTLEDGVLHRSERGGDIRSQRILEDFELEFGWQVAPGGNGGVKYRLVSRERSDGERVWGSVGCEYQVLDDLLHPNAASDLTRAASLYGVWPAATESPTSGGRYYQGRIVARGARIEHWLDGARTLSLSLDDPAFDEALAASKFATVGDYGRSAGPIQLQDHGDSVWYRDLVARDWNDLPGERVELFDGQTLAGWFELGDASYTVTDEGTLLGQVDGGGQSFLTSERTFGDFILELELKTGAQGNSGVQIRSALIEPDKVPNTRLRGYQIEIDPKTRAWSGGLYDEARRGWLDDLSDNRPAREAFRVDAWNRYRIEAVGPWIRTWVNGVPAADYIDFEDFEGHFGLQVHSGTDTRVEWRKLVVQDLGRHGWQSLDFSDEASWRADTAGGSIEYLTDSKGTGFTLVTPGGGGVFGREKLEDFSLRFDLLSQGGLNVGVVSEAVWQNRLSGSGTFANATEDIGDLDSLEAGAFEFWGGFGLSMVIPQGDYYQVHLARYGTTLVVDVDGQRALINTLEPHGPGALFFQPGPGAKLAKIYVRNAELLVPSD